MKSGLSFLAACVLAMQPLAAHADLPGEHPGYLHALSDLRAARWNLQHRPGDVKVSTMEDIAISEVDRAIGEVKKAARDDLKNPDLKLHEDASLDHTGRLRHAAELLEQTRSDLASEEDNPDAREHRRRALEHVDRAIDSTRHAVQDIVSAAKTVH